MMAFTLYYGTTCQNSFTTQFAHRQTVESFEDLLHPLRFDHVLSEFKDGQRKESNFLRSDCVPMDIDNSESDAPMDWVDVDDLKGAFPDVQFYYVFSRHHMKVKGGKEGRPKFHVYFPLGKYIESLSDYTEIKRRAMGIFPYFDKATKDASRMFFGVSSVRGGTVEGSKTLLEFLNDHQDITPTVKADVFSVPSDESSDIVRDRNQWLENWLRDMEIPYQFKDGFYYVRCINEEKHSTHDRGTKLFYRKDSGICFKCHHAHCEHLGWREYRLINETLKKGREAPQGSPSVIVPKKLSEFERREVDWLIKGYIPRHAITVLGADGGVGKTSVWCNLVASISSGRFSILEKEYEERGYPPPDPKKVMFLSSEDAIEEVLLGRLEDSGANKENIITVSLADDCFNDIKFSSDLLRQLLEAHRPSLVVFDPLQSFISPSVHMGERNAMRNELNPLIGYCSLYDSTALIIMHTNKQSGIWGRKRLADSSDIWDIARSVLMLGETSEKGIRYISQEKSNYGQTSKTVLFTTPNGVATFHSFSTKKDKDFVTERNFTQKEAPKLETAIEMILDVLQDGRITEKELRKTLTENGVSNTTYTRAKKKLSSEKKINSFHQGFGSDIVWYVELSADPDENPFQ